jgi:hypothetical protein
LEKDGVPISMLLDVVESAESHSGVNLAIAFAKILKDFGISNKVSTNSYLEKQINYLLATQILSVSCDNATNNDSMIVELAKLVAEFPGPANQTRCFLHVLNLVVKSIIKQFDLPKTQKGELDDALDDALLELANDLEDEVQAQDDTDNLNNEDDDNAEGWIDERELMTAIERENLDKSVGPLRLMLTKVRKIMSELESSYKNCVVAENGVCYQKFNNTFTAKVVFCTRRTKTKCSYDSP